VHVNGGAVTANAPEQRGNMAVGGSTIRGGRVVFFSSVGFFFK
jgi:hypothetical protein